MKNIYLMVGAFALVMAGFSGTAIAKDKKHEKAKENAVVTSQSAESRSNNESSGPKRFAVGVTTISNGSNTTGGSGSLTGLLEFDAKNTVQPIFSISSTSPFIFTVGGIYKHNLVEKQGAGLHVGGTVMLGTVGNSIANITNAVLAGGTASSTTFGGSVGGIGGVHFSLPGMSDIAFHFDGGALLSFGGSTAFGISPLSPIAGMSVMLFL